MAPLTLSSTPAYKDIDGMVAASYQTASVMPCTTDPSSSWSQRRGPGGRREMSAAELSWRTSLSTPGELVLL